jgi:hypothetical protein
MKKFPVIIALILLFSMIHVIYQHQHKPKPFHCFNCGKSPAQERAEYRDKR